MGKYLILFNDIPHKQGDNVTQTFTDRLLRVEENEKIFSEEKGQ